MITFSETFALKNVMLTPKLPIKSTRNVIVTQPVYGNLKIKLMITVIKDVTQRIVMYVKKV